MRLIYLAYLRLRLHWHTFLQCTRLWNKWTKTIRIAQPPTLKKLNRRILVTNTMCLHAHIFTSLHWIAVGIHFMDAFRKCMCTKNHCKRLSIQYHRQRRIILCYGLQHRRHTATNVKVCYGVLQGKVLDALNAESNAMKNAKIYWMQTAYKVCY